MMAISIDETVQELITAAIRKAPRNKATSTDEIFI